MTRRQNLLSISEAIDKAGQVLFGDDWINRLDRTDVKLLERHGPKPPGHSLQSIKRCPPHLSRRLDRVIGRDVRLGIQRATVLDWLFSARVMSSRNNCDPAKLEQVLTHIRKGSERRRRRPPVDRIAVAQKMLAEIRTGAVTIEDLDKMKQQALKDEYGKARKTCVEARKIALAEARHQRGMNS